MDDVIRMGPDVEIERYEYGWVLRTYSAKRPTKAYPNPTGRTCKMKYFSRLGDAAMAVVDADCSSSGSAQVVVDGLQQTRDAVLAAVDGASRGYAETVLEFTKAYNDSVPKFPQKMDDEGVAFIKQMVNDELAELEVAENAAEQADALIDAIYYLFDCGIRHGINLDPIFDIVHSANMQKVVDGKVIRREDGKVMKPEGWEDPGPKVEAEIQRQLANGAFRR